MPFDLDALLKDLGATGEEETTLRAALGKPERLSVLEKNQLRQSDYSKHQNALKKSQDDLQAAQQRLDAEVVAWAEMRAKGETESAAQQEAREKAEQKVLVLTQRVQRIATDAGLDPAKALEGIEQAPPAKKEEPKPCLLYTSPSPRDA